jgi:hypothetical protein
MIDAVVDRLEKLWSHIGYVLAEWFILIAGGAIAVFMFHQCASMLKRSLRMR